MTAPTQPGWLTAHRRAVYLVVALLSAAGILAGLRIPAAIYPELRFARITIVAQGPALGARQMLFSVTRPIEEAVSIVPGVSRVESRTIRGGSETTVTFTGATEMSIALQQVQSRLAQVQPEFPDGTTTQVEQLTPALFPILSYNLEGGDPATLYDIARYQIKPVFSRVPGVARVDVLGSVEREVEVVADPVRLAGAGLSWTQLGDAIREGTTVEAVGRLPEDYRQYLIVSATEAHSADAVRAIAVRPGLTVGDVADVRLGTTDRVKAITGNGRPAALLNVSRQVGGNTVAIADSIAGAARTFAAELPPGVHLVPVYDQSELVRDAVRSVRDAMLIGAVLAVLVLLAFLREPRITMISAAVIPLTMAITVLVMALIGQSFNLMTLGAMAIAIGLVIDDAVVVTENIVRHVRRTSDRALAVREAVRELGWPVTTSTLTTVVVFLPLGLLTGVEGQFFKALSVTLTIAVLVSLALAFTIIPLLSARYLRPVEDAADGSAPRLDRLTERYARSLAAVLDHRTLALAVAALLVAGGAVTYRMVGTGFLPEMDEGAFVLDYFTPGGTALDETDRQLHVVEEILAGIPEIAGTSRRTGAEMGLFATGQNTGDLVARLVSAGERHRSTQEVIDDARTQIETRLPALRIEFVPILSDVLNDLAGVHSPVEIKLFGGDLDALERYGRELAGALEPVAGLEDLYDGVSERAAEMRMVPRGDELRRAGLTVADLDGQVADAMLGRAAGEVVLDDRTIGIRVRAPDSLRASPGAIAALPITVPGSAAPVPLRTFATLIPGETRDELRRENQQQLITITAELAGRPLGDVMRDVRRIVGETPPPAGVRLELAGQYAGQRAAFRTLLLVLTLAALSVVTVMVVQFRSFIEPAVILLAAPLSFVGGLALLWFTGTALNVAALMGFILLVGLVVKNGIILLDVTRHHAAEGMALREAISAAARIRLRPILMTTLCTLVGLFPLALGLGPGSDLQRPLALTVIGGLALSTPVTLYLVPILLVAIRSRHYPTERTTP